MPAKKGWTKALSHIYSAKCRQTKEKIFKKYRDWICTKKVNTVICVFYANKFNLSENSIFIFTVYLKILFLHSRTHTRTPLFQFILIYVTSYRTRSKRIFCKCSKMYSSIFECKSWQNRKNFSQWRRCGNLVFTINPMDNKKQIKCTVSSDLVSLNFML